MTDNGTFNIGPSLACHETGSLVADVSKIAVKAWDDYNQEMARELDRLLPSWVSEVDLPQLIFDDSGRFLGLGDASEGRKAAIYVPARAFVLKPPLWAMGPEY